MEEMLKENWLLLLPIAIIYYGFVIFCIVDLFKTEREVKGPKIIWLLILLLVNPLGLFAYLLFAKGE